MAIEAGLIPPDRSAPHRADIEVSIYSPTPSRRATGTGSC